MYDNRPVIVKCTSSFITYSDGSEVRIENEGERARAMLWIKKEIAFWERIRSMMISEFNTVSCKIANIDTRLALAKAGFDSEFSQINMESRRMSLLAELDFIHAKECETIRNITNLNKEEYRISHWDNRR